MTGTALVYRHDEPVPEVTEFASADDVSALGWLQKQVGGYIEIVPQFTRIARGGAWRECVAFCNEEGKIQRPPLPLNFEATALWNAALGGRLVGSDGIPRDYLVGNIVVLFGDREFMAAL